MLHPDYDLMIVRLERESRLRENMREYELRRALGPSLGLWGRIGQWMRRLALNLNPSERSARLAMKRLNRRSSQT